MSEVALHVKVATVASDLLARNPALGFLGACRAATVLDAAARAQVTKAAYLAACQVAEEVAQGAMIATGAPRGTPPAIWEHTPGRTVKDVIVALRAYAWTRAREE